MMMLQGLEVHCKLFRIYIYKTFNHFSFLYELTIHLTYVNSYYNMLSDLITCQNPSRTVLDPESQPLSRCDSSHRNICKNE